MIIADHHSWRKRLGKNWKLILVGLMLLTALIYFGKPLFLLWSTKSRPDVIYFDAEHIWKKNFISNGRFFEKAKSQSDDAAFRGNYSSRVEEGEGYQYGVSGRVKVMPGEVYQATVWFLAPGKNATPGIAFQAEDANLFYQATSEVAKYHENGWRKLLLEVRIPDNFSQKELIFYVFTNGDEVVYFDDLEVKKLEEEQASSIKESFNPRLLNLSFKEKAFRKIEAKRRKALSAGVLITEEDSWVKAELEEGEETFPVRVRLKGDWLDHLLKDKWSFRLKVKDPYAWNRLVVFSLHSPAARYYADEWLIHQAWLREDVLSPRYDFLNLSLNGKFLGTYAFEEHFDKQLLEFNNRREGPIVRFVEDALWEKRLKDSQSGTVGTTPLAARHEFVEISPFKEGRTVANPKLKASFEIARTLMEQYRQGEVGLEQVFDLERLGKYYAIADLFGAYHAQIWHNQRFYYNPVIGKLEPIGFDAFGAGPTGHEYSLGHVQIEYSQPHYIATFRELVHDESFLRVYLKYLNQFTSPVYLDGLFRDLGQGLKEREAFLQMEFPKYSFNKNLLYRRAKKLRARLLPYRDHSVRGFWATNVDGKRVLKAQNLHSMPLQVVGTSTNSSRMIYPLKEPRLLPALYIGYPLERIEFEAPRDAKFLFYQTPGIDSLFSVAITAWSLEAKPIPPQELFSNAQLKSNDWYELRNEQLYFKTGKHLINRDIVIPESVERVVIDAGTELDFRGGSKFVSNAPVMVNGTQDRPVYIHSSDKSANGFSVFQASGRSRLTYTVFDNFNTLNDRGWELTGAVTFYESDVDLINCIFENNHCEDGLNLIRSDFLMTNVVVRDTPFDGFDADFCTGLVQSCVFENTGNDGFDVSGSQIEIEASRMINNGDKGISVGEESRVVVKSAIVDGAVIGAASKDLSFLKIEQITLKNCNQGLAAYQKKPEYGPSTIQVLDYQAEEVKYLHTIAPYCKLYLKGKLITGE